VLEESGVSRESDAAGPINLFTKWWFYVLLFLAIYAFTVAVHLYFDYRQWEQDSAKLIHAEAAAAQSASSSKAQQPAQSASSSKAQQPEGKKSH
ncbi:unnamed protein product, partial [Polarella glacialis]